MYLGFTTLTTEGSCLMKLKMPMPEMNKNQTQRMGAKVYPTLSVPNLWTMKRSTKIATEAQTTASAHKNIY